MLKNNNNLNKTDEELVKLTLQNKDYYRFLIERYKKKLKRYIFRVIIVNPENEEDILQEVFIKAYINLNDFDPSLKFSSWIYRIAHNEAINFLRKNKNKLLVANIEINKIFLEKIRVDLDIEEKIDQKYLLDNIQKIINNLHNKNYKNVLILKYIEEKDYREISDILKKPMGTVATLLNRAKKQVRKELLKNNKLNIK